jgi:hypothetical protein
MRTLTRLLERFAAAPAAAENEAAAAAETPSAPPLPTRQVEGRREFHGLLWRPVLGVNDDEKLVVAARAGLPHCVRCERALTLAAGPRELWTCPSCGDSRPGSDADFFAAEAVIADDLREFISGHPDFRLAPTLSAPQRALA